MPKAPDSPQAPSRRRAPTREELRLQEAADRTAHWKRWGPYLSERQWGTVREDYSPHGAAWEFFPHDHARSRAYRWGEDGIAGISDNHGRLCFALALWNGRDPILKERLFGLDRQRGQSRRGRQGVLLLPRLDADALVHEVLSTSIRRRSFPTRGLVEENRAGAIAATLEFELMDTGVFDDDRYFDVVVEYAKADAPTTSSSASPRPIAARRRQSCICCRPSGFATPGRGTAGGPGRPTLRAGTAAASGIAVIEADHRLARRALALL